MTTVHSMDDIEDFFQQETLNRLAADQKVSPEQLVQPGDYCVHECADFLIYSEILDAAQHQLRGRSVSSLDAEELAEYQETKESYECETMRHYRFTRSYSECCTYGELGDLHISTILRKISRQEFEQAKAKGWT